MERIKFCIKCKSLMSFKVIHETLQYVCEMCAYTEPLKQQCVKVSGISHNFTSPNYKLFKNLKYDMTIPRTFKVKCPNCPSLEEKEEKGEEEEEEKGGELPAEPSSSSLSSLSPPLSTNEILVFQPNKDSLKLGYFCPNCKQLFTST